MEELKQLNQGLTMHCNLGGNSLTFLKDCLDPLLSLFLCLKSQTTYASDR